jgi:hypothetical protein
MFVEPTHATSHVAHQQSPTSQRPTIKIPAASVQQPTLSMNEPHGPYHSQAISPSKNIKMAPATTDLAASNIPVTAGHYPTIIARPETTGDSMPMTHQVEIEEVKKRVSLLYNGKDLGIFLIF